MLVYALSAWDVLWIREKPWPQHNSLEAPVSVRNAGELAKFVELQGSCL
jgi:hypothetical protein